MKREGPYRAWHHRSFRKSTVEERRERAERFGKVREPILPLYFFSFISVVEESSEVKEHWRFALRFDISAEWLERPNVGKLLYERFTQNQKDILKNRKYNDC